MIWKNMRKKWKKEGMWFMLAKSQAFYTTLVFPYVVRSIVVWAAHRNQFPDIVKMQWIEHTRNGIVTKSCIQDRYVAVVGTQQTHQWWRMRRCLILPRTAPCGTGCSYCFPAAKISNLGFGSQACILRQKLHLSLWHFLPLIWQSIYNLFPVYSTPDKQLSYVSILSCKWVIFVGKDMPGYATYKDGTGTVITGSTQEQPGTVYM